MNGFRMTSRRSGARLASGQRGVGMIEILVALLILSIGVLGYAGLQLRALGSTNESHFRVQAMAIAQDMAERIPVNPESLAIYSSAGSWSQAAFADRSMPAGWNQCVTGSCNTASVAQWDILQARYQAWTLLPNGRISANACAANLVCITVGWNDADPTNCDPASEDCVVLEVMPL